MIMAAEKSEEKVIPKGEGKSIIIIPARMKSNRLPNKPLLLAGGKALVHWTWERAKQTSADYVIVASPDREICDYCRANNIPWMVTREDHPNGTCRCFEILEVMKPERLDQLDVVINFQCDSPLVLPGYVDQLIELVRNGVLRTEEKKLKYMSSQSVYTLSAPAEPRHLDNYNTIKVAEGKRGKCCWFSRSPMAGARAHCGVYAFTPSALSGIYSDTRDFGVSELSKAESLEQLSWIEWGYRILALGMENLPLEINTELDFYKFKTMVENQS